MLVLDWTFYQDFLLGVFGKQKLRYNNLQDLRDKYYTFEPPLQPNLHSRSALSLDLIRFSKFLSNTRLVDGISKIPMRGNNYKFSSLNLALYPTDWTGENFSVDRTSDGGAVKLVDLENIVSFHSEFLVFDIFIIRSLSI